MVIGPDFVYVGIPRTATNTMSRVFLPQFGGVSDGRDHSRDIPPEHRNKFTFAVVRNPYDRILSAWYHNCRCSVDRQSFPMGFLQFMERMMGDWDDSGSNQVEFLSGVKVNSILRYETLAENVLALPFNKARIPWPTVRLNSEDRPPWQQELIRHPEYAAVIERYSGQDFCRFHYALWVPEGT